MTKYKAWTPVKNLNAIASVTLLYIPKNITQNKTNM